MLLLLLPLGHLANKGKDKAAHFSRSLINFSTVFELR
jgi:hypothetical protein